jgi:hypothetical protein
MENWRREDGASHALPGQKKNLILVSISLYYIEEFYEGKLNYLFCWKK